MIKSTALTQRRMLQRRGALAPLAALMAAATLAACGGGGDAAAEPPANEIAVEEFPDYYPADYQDIIDGSKDEGGVLEIYSNTDQENWAPIFRDFQKKYPWVETINANNLDSDEVFQRVLSEQATGGSPADILVSNAAQAWAEYGEDPSRLMTYESPELGELPDFATLMPNIYAFSMDPIVIPYNTSLDDRGADRHGDLAGSSRRIPTSSRTRSPCGTSAAPSASPWPTRSWRPARTSGRAWSSSCRWPGRRPARARRTRRSSRASTWPASTSVPRPRTRWWRTAAACSR